MHIIWIGYLFVVLMFCAAQPSIARMVILLVILAVLPTIFVAWILRTRRRNQLSRWQQVLADREKDRHEAQQSKEEI